jgi:transposase InsO family protein
MLETTAEVDRRMDWKILLAYITGSVDQELLLRHESLTMENRILRQRITGRVRLSDGERATLAEIGKQLGKQARQETARIWRCWWRRTFSRPRCGPAAGLVTYDVLFFIHLARRKVHIAGLTPHPDARWMMQIARNVRMADWGALQPGRYLIHDRESKYCPAFQQIIDQAGVTCVPLPPRSPHLNVYAERWVRSVKEEAVSRLMLFDEHALWHALIEYVTHFHEERPHQGKGNVVLRPSLHHRAERHSPIRCRGRLGGLLKYYSREAA